MKKLSCLMFAVVFYFIGHAQNFNKSFEANPNVLGTLNIIILAQDSFVIFPASFNNNRLGFTYAKLNSNGDSIVTKNYTHTNAILYTGWSNSTTLLSNKGYIMGGGLTDSIDYGTFFRFKPNGDTLWTRNYGDTSNAFNTLRQAIPTKDGGFIGVGQTDRRVSSSDGWVIKVDSLGNFEWEKVLGQLNQLEGLSSIAQTYDGGFICGGMRRHFAGNPPVNNVDPLIMKLDTAGNLQWQYVYDTPYNESTACVIQTFDSNYVFSSSISISQPSSASNGKPALFKLTQYGGLLWAKTYGNTASPNFFIHVKQLPDSNLIAVGRRKNFAKTEGLMVHTDKNGDSLFVESYEYNASNSQDENALWDVEQTSDGGFIAAGRVIERQTVPYIDNARIIRVDSNGCILSNCAVGLPEGINKKADKMVAYPNPVKDYLRFAGNIEDIVLVEIWDLKGRRVKEIHHAKAALNLGELAGGVYVLRIYTHQAVHEHKLIKE